MIAYRRLLFTGDTVMPEIPHVPLGKPFAFEIFSQVSPPSLLFHNAEPSPPLDNSYGFRWTRQVEAYKMRELLGSMMRSTAPARSLTNKTCFDVLPPSMDLYIPRSLVSLNTSPRTATYTISGLFGFTL